MPQVDCYTRTLGDHRDALLLKFMFSFIRGIGFHGIQHTFRVLHLSLSAEENPIVCLGPGFAVKT